MHSMVLFAQKLKTTSDSVANESSKSFTVPAGKRWIINTVWVEFTSSATVGNRQIEVSVNSAASADELYFTRSGAVQAASLTRYYLFGTGIADLTSFRDTDFLMTPLPAPMEMDPGEVLIVRDVGGTARAAIKDGTDDMVVHVRYYEQQDI